MMKLSFVIIAVLFALFGCQEARFARGFAGPIEQAHGLKVWESKKAVSVDLRIHYGKPIIDGNLIFNVHTGQSRIVQNFGDVLVFTHGRAWVSKGASTERARFHLLTWPYFIAAPFKLRDPGTHLADTGMRQLNGKTYRTAKLTFDPGTGDTPDDYYIVYADPTTGRLDAMVYIVTYGKRDGAELPTSIILYDAFDIIDGVTLPTKWRTCKWDEQAQQLGDVKGTGELANYQFIEPDATTFRLPPVAVEDQLPDVNTR